MDEKRTPVKDPGGLRTFDRRQVMAMGSSIALGPWLGGLAAASVGSGPTPLSVGYLYGSDRLASLDRLSWLENPELFDNGLLLELGGLEVEPARRLPAGDPSFGWELVEITIHGLYPSLPEASTATLRRAALEVWYRTAESALKEPLPYLAWSFARDPVLNVGSDNRFLVPVDRRAGLTITLEVENGAPSHMGLESLSRRRTFETTFTVNLEADRPKLQRGVYFLGFESDCWTRSRRLLNPADRRAQRLLSLVLSVELADARLGTEG